MDGNRADYRDAVIYTFDPSTGFIGSTVSGSWHKDHEVFMRPHTIVADGHIPAVHTIVDSYGETREFNCNVPSGWTLLLNEKGDPQVDENGSLLLSPPPHHVPDPDIMTYIFLAQTRSGHIDPKEVHRDVITDVNHRLAKIGQSIIPGTELLPHPQHSAITRSKKV